MEGPSVDKASRMRLIVQQHDLTSKWLIPVAISMVEAQASGNACGTLSAPILSVIFTTSSIWGDLRCLSHLTARGIRSIDFPMFKLPSQPKASAVQPWQMGINFPVLRNPT